MESATRVISEFQYPYDSACTPYGATEFAPEVVQLATDECDLLQENVAILKPRSDTSASTTNRNVAKCGNNCSSGGGGSATNPFSLATTAAAANNRLRVAKCVVVGDVSVGKTTLINRFINEQFCDAYKATIGVDFEVQKFDILGRPFTLQIWDTAGQSRFRDITRIYYRGAHAVLICFDLGNFSSFLNVKFWLNEVLQNCAPDSSAAATETGTNLGPIDETHSLDHHRRPFIFMIGTKKDLVEPKGHEAVDQMARECAEMAAQIGAEFWMVSAAVRANEIGDHVVGDLFQRVACLTFDRYMAAIATAAQAEIDDKAKQERSGVRYSGGGVTIALPRKVKGRKSKKGDAQQEVNEEEDEEREQDGDAPNGTKRKRRKRSKRNSSRTLIRVIDVPREMISKMAANIVRQCTELWSKRKKRTSSKIADIHRQTGTATPDSGVFDPADQNWIANNNNNNSSSNNCNNQQQQHNNINGSTRKGKRKTFSCFNIRCTFTVEP